MQKIIDLSKETVMKALILFFTVLFSGIAVSQELSENLVGTWKQVSKICETTGEAWDLTNESVKHPDIVFKENGEYGIPGNVLGQVVQDEERGALVFVDHHSKANIVRVFFYRFEGRDRLQISFFADDMNVGSCPTGQFETLTVEKVSADTDATGVPQESGHSAVKCEAYKERQIRLERYLSELNYPDSNGNYADWLRENIDIMKRSYAKCLAGN